MGVSNVTPLQSKWRARKSQYDDYRAWSDKFIPEIKQIVGPHLLDISSFEVDANEATDLIVFKSRDVRVAARVRSHGLKDEYLWQFTIRSKVRSGGKTELAKMIEGWGDLMLYAHAAKDDTHLDRWFLIDLAAWRAQLIQDALRDERKVVHGDKDNYDGTAFKWFDLRSFDAEPSILRAGSHPLPTIGCV